jgi:hypothetical protein
VSLTQGLMLLATLNPILRRELFAVAIVSALPTILAYGPSQPRC